jgi:hypothetical protein
MASDHVGKVGLTPNLLEILRWVINHWNNITIWNNIECLAVQFLLCNGGIERLARQHSVRPRKGDRWDPRLCSCDDRETLRVIEENELEANTQDNMSRARHARKKTYTTERMAGDTNSRVCLGNITL